MVSAYVLGYGGFMLLGGRAADLLGRRRMFLLWLTVFLVFSGLGGFATEGWMLLVARFVTGVAAAFMTPAGLSLITTSFAEGPLRNKALLVYAGTAAGGFSLGLVVGGLLTALGWRWVFFAPVILAAVILLAAIPLIKEPAVPRARRRAASTWPGAVDHHRRDAAAGLRRGPAGASRPTAGAGTVAVFAGGLGAAGGASWPIERRSADAAGPAGHPALGGAGPRQPGGAAVRSPRSSASSSWSPSTCRSCAAGRRCRPASRMLADRRRRGPRADPHARGWSNRFGNARVIFGGLVLAPLAYALFLPRRDGLDVRGHAADHAPARAGVRPGVRPADHRRHRRDRRARAGLAGGLLYTSFQFGAALGLSAVTAVSVAALGDATTPEAMLDSLRIALVVPVAAAVAGALITAFGIRPPHRRSRSAAEHPRVRPDLGVRTS